MIIYINIFEIVKNIVLFIGAKNSLENIYKLLLIKIAIHQVIKLIDFKFISYTKE
jgi:hypothetical protein